MALASPQPSRPRRLRTVGELRNRQIPPWDMAGAPDLDADLAFLRRSTVFNGRYQAHPMTENEHIHDDHTHPALVVAGVIGSSLIVWGLILAAIVFLAS